MQASDAHPKASDGHPKPSDGRTKAANGQFISTEKTFSPSLIENRKLLYERRQSASRRPETALHASPSRFLQITKAALSMIESARKEHRSLLYNHPKATMRMTKAYRENDRKPPCSNKKIAARWPPPRSTFHFLLFTFHFRRTHFSFPKGCTFHSSLFTFTSVKRPTSPPSSAAHTVPGWL